MQEAKVVARLEGEVKRSLRSSGLAELKSLVVAVSGGPDSLALLHALCRLRAGLGLRLYGAHLDHGLRGVASEADADFVSETFARLDVGIAIERAAVPSFRKRHHLSTEEAARRVRYDFLARVATEQKADAIALGHTADDQAETVLMNIIRGAGLSGLRGMMPVSRRTIGGERVLLLRPLLRSSRQDTLDYCNELRLSPRIDESNLSTEARRNRIRLELLPLLEQYNPAIKDALTRLSSGAAQQVEYLDETIDSVWQEVVRQRDGFLAIDQNAYLVLHPALRGHLLRRAVGSVKGDLKDIEQGHIEEMDRLMGGTPGKTLDLPGGLRFVMGYSEATVTPAGRDHCPLPPFEGEHELTVPGETQASGWHITASFVEPGSAVESDHPPAHGPEGLRARMSYQSVAGALSVRTRRPGDRFQPLGMSRHKKLQDFMVDAKIPRWWRDRVPLVLSPRGVAWVVGWRTAQWARASKDDSQLLELAFVPDDRPGG